MGAKNDTRVVSRSTLLRVLKIAPTTSASYTVGVKNRTHILSVVSYTVGTKNDTCVGKPQYICGC